MNFGASQTEGMGATGMNTARKSKKKGKKKKKKASNNEGGDE